MPLRVSLSFPVSCALLLATLPLCARAAPTVPLDAFVGQEMYSRPRLAPDGRHIAVTVQVPAGERTVPVLMTYTLPDMKVSGAIRLPLFTVPVDYQWVTNERLVVAKGLELGSREKPVASGELLATDLDGKRQEYLFGYRMYAASSRGTRYGDDDAFSYLEFIPRERNGHALVTSRLWDTRHSLLYDTDTRNAKRKLLADLPLDGLGFLVQNDGTPRFAYGSGTDNEPVLFRRDAAGGAWERMQTSGTRYLPLAFSRDDRQLMAMVSKDGEPDSVVREDLATGKRVTLFADPVAAPQTLLFGADYDLPFGAVSGTGVPRVVYFDADDANARLHKLLAQQFPGSQVGFDGFSDDGRLTLFHVSSDRDPGSWYLFDKTSGKADLLFSSMEAIYPDDMAERRPISLRARDGLELHGFLTMPAHAPGVRPPLVLLPHGGPHGDHDTWFFDVDAQFLASRGYAVLQVNYRGSSGRGPAFRQAGYREWGGKIQDDLVDAVRWAIAQGEVDGERVCAYGTSFGGYAALMLAARAPGLLRCAVGYAGIYDLNLLARTDEARADERMANAVARYVGTDKAELDRFSPVAQAARITVPVLLVHGGKDKRAPLAHAEAMRAALAREGRPPDWFLAPTEGHGFYDTANRAEFYRRLEAFLGKHIGKAK
ncbi:S9 family peptidase [uncultured Massilia sp.]|uniref:S9 family peptidase n=1 Tax=uncultured Massilia sp. TaxID=169973 RepID=UPI0025E6CA96|nr:S9 family peptidase [uncultured Massilia sp.]